MRIDFDPAKSQKNAEERGLAFDLVEGFNWLTATIEPDLRFDYAEHRFIATGHIGERLHVVCFTPTADGVRVISFRKANKKETRNHAKTTAY